MDWIGKQANPQRIAGQFFSQVFVLAAMCRSAQLNRAAKHSPRGRPTPRWMHPRLGGDDTMRMEQGSRDDRR